MKNVSNIVFIKGVLYGNQFSEKCYTLEIEMIHKNLSTYVEQNYKKIYEI